MAISELRKALTTSTGGGSSLHAEDLEKNIRSQLFLHSPLLSLIDKVPASSQTHTIVKRTAGFTAGVVGEMAAASYGNSTYARRNFTQKIVRVDGYQLAALA